MHHISLFTVSYLLLKPIFFQAETLSEIMFKSPPSLNAEYLLKEFFQRTARSPSPRRTRFAPAYIIWQDSKNTVCENLLSTYQHQPPPPKNQPNTGTPRSQRSEIPGVAGRQGASPRCDEDNKGKRAAWGELGKRGLGRARNGGGEGWAPGTKAPTPSQLPAWARKGGGSPTRTPEGSRHPGIPALRGPWARGSARSQRRCVPAGIGERERGSGRRLALLPGIGRGAALGP